MKQRKSAGNIIIDGVIIAILALFALLCLIPIIHVLFASISDPAALARHSGLVWRPLGFTLKGFELVFNNKFIASGYLNTIFYVVTSTTIGVFLSTMGGYALSRRNLLWGNAIMVFIMITMFFSGGLVPLFLVIKSLHMYDTRLAVILPVAVSTFNLIIMRTAMAEMPTSLEEAAKIDGAGHFLIFYKIAVPLAKASIAVIVLFYAVGNWNAWFNASIFLQDKLKFPLQLIVRDTIINNDTSGMMQGSNVSADAALYKQLVKYCTIIVTTLPILCIYPFLQKYFVKGVMIGSLKG